MANPCSTCGATFIESFPDHRGWWVGCKPCGRALRQEHVHGGDEHEAVEKWNKRNPQQSDAFVESAVKVHGALSESQEKHLDARGDA